MRNARRALWLALALAACSGPAVSQTTPSPTPAPTASATPAPPAGWSTTTRASDGFSIALPPTWRAIALDPQTFASAYKTLADQNPSFAAALSPEQAQG